LLSQQEPIHYSRHIILSEIDETGQKKLKLSIAGAGGLRLPLWGYPTYE